jgi:hypothetical protein
MKYNPNEELTDEQLKQLSEDDFFEYIDGKAAYLKQFTQPLGQYHTKQFASQTKGAELTTKELKRAKEIGRIGDDMRAQAIAEAATKITAKVPDLNVKGHKTHRSQWVD